MAALRGELHSAQEIIWRAVLLVGAEKRLRNYYITPYSLLSKAEHLSIYPTVKLKWSTRLNGKFAMMPIPFNTLNFDFGFSGFKAKTDFNAKTKTKAKTNTNTLRLEDYIHKTISVMII